jgi:hypothetical protein
VSGVGPSSEAEETVEGSEEDTGLPAGDALAMLASQKLSRARMVRRELRKLPSILGEGEQALNLARGEYDGKEGLLAVTDRRVLFLEEGMIRHRLEDFPYDKISSVQTKTGMRSGELTIFVSGNKATVKDVHPKQRAPEIGDYVRQRIASGPTQAPAAAAPQAAPGTPTESPMEQLKKLAELRDAGIVSEEEFEAKKAELLSRM